MANTSVWKPHGYTSVSPYLVVDGAQTLIDFLKQTFGAAALRRYEREDGRILHAEVRIGDSVVMMSDATPDWPPLPSNIHVYVEDVDAVYARGLAAGGVAIQEPAQRGDPDRRGGFRDPVGNAWWVATQQEPDPTLPAA